MVMEFAIGNHRHDVLVVPNIFLPYWLARLAQIGNIQEDHYDLNNLLNTTITHIMIENAVRRELKLV